MLNSFEPKRMRVANNTLKKRFHARKERKKRSSKIKEFIKKIFNIYV